MASNPTALASGRSPRVEVPVGGTLLLLVADSVSICSTSRLPIAVAEPVQLLGNGSSPANDLQVELLERLIEKSNRDVPGAHIGRVPKPWNFTQREKSPGLLLLDPQNIYLHVSELRDTLPLHDANRSAGIHANTSPHGRAAKVGEECEDPQCLRGCAHNGV